MNSIEITQKQKDKLLEMCKVLFPEYTHIYFRVDSKSSVVYPYDKEVDNNILRIGKFGVLDLSIHWFEFCFTHLSHKIIFIAKNNLNMCNYNHAGLLESTMSLFYNEKNAIHPVDYLYEQFKKIKQ